MKTEQTILLTWEEMVDTFQSNMIYDMARICLSPKEMVKEMKANAEALESVLIPNEKGIETVKYLVTTGYARDIVPKDFMRSIREHEMDLHIVDENEKVIVSFSHKEIK